MDLVLAGLAIVAFFAAFYGFFLGVMRFEEARQRKGYARIGAPLELTPEVKGQFARWRLWGISGVHDGCVVEVRTVVGGGTSLPSFLGNTGHANKRPLITRVFVRPPRGRTLPRGVLFPAAVYPGKAPTDFEPRGLTHDSTDSTGRMWAYGELRLDSPVEEIAGALEKSRAALWVEADRIEVWLQLPTSRRSTERITSALEAAVLAAHAFSQAERGVEASG